MNNLANLKAAMRIGILNKRLSKISDKIVEKHKSKKKEKTEFDKTLLDKAKAKRERIRIRNIKQMKKIY